MVEKAKQWLHWVPGWIPIIISVASMLVAGGMWYQGIEDHFKQTDTHFQFIEKSMESRDKKIEAIQDYLMSTRSLTDDAPSYNPYRPPSKQSKPPTSAPAKHSHFVPFLIIPAAHSDLPQDATNKSPF